MSWERIIGQHHAKRILIAAIRNRTIAHAYCLWGPDGVGKDALAIEFARVLNCLRPLQFDSSIDACGSCKSCLLMERLQHPNVQLVFSLPAAQRSNTNDDTSPLLKLTDEQIALIQEQLLLKARNPYHTIALPNAMQIRIASIRDISRTLQLSAPIEHGWRVVIISHAESMTDEAANAFLKTLEEPHPYSTIILTTSRPDRIRPTIRSRCQLIHCGSLSTDEISSALIRQSRVEPDRARLLASLAQGSYARALELAASPERYELSTEQTLNFLRTVIKPTPYRTALYRSIESISQQTRTEISMMLQILLMWLQDAYKLRLFGVGAQPQLVFQHGPLLSSLMRFVERFPHAKIDTMLCAIEQALIALESNAQIPLTLLALCVHLRRAIENQPVVKQ